MKRFCFSVIMDKYTSLGEWSDGDDDWVWEIDEEAILKQLNDGKDDDPIVAMVH